MQTDMKALIHTHDVYYIHVEYMTVCAVSCLRVRGEDKCPHVHWPSIDALELLA